MNDEQKRLLGEAIEHADKAQTAIREVLRLEHADDFDPLDYPYTTNEQQLEMIERMAGDVRDRCIEYAQVGVGKTWGTEEYQTAEWIKKLQGWFAANERRGCKLRPEYMRCTCGSTVFERDVVVCARMHREIGFHPFLVEALRDQGHEL